MSNVFKIHRPICIDYETFFKTGSCSVKSDMKHNWPGGPWLYTHHKDFYPYLIAWMDIETRERGVIQDRAKFKDFVGSLNGRTVIAHNCLFEYEVSRVINPEFNPMNMVDTSDIAAYNQCPRDLERAAHFLLSKKISKAIRDSMSGVHFSELTSDVKKAMVDYALNDVETEVEIFEKYYPTWPALEAWMSDLNRRQNADGLHVDSNYMQEQLDRIYQVRSRAISNIPWCDSSEDTPLSAKKLSVWCREVGIEPPISLAEDDEDCIVWENKYGEQFPVVSAMRDFRKSNTILKKLNRIELLLRPDGTIPLDTLYFAAVHTGRFSSRGVNVQNLPKDSSLCDLRGCFVPTPGHKFIGADLAGVEARCLPYLAGDHDYLSEVAKLDSQASGGDTGDLYEPHARRMFGYVDSEPLKKKDKDLRFATKTCILALGFQSGAKKFFKTISQGVPERVLDRVRIGKESTEDLALRLVKLYRSSNPKVQELWYSLDRDLRASCSAGTNFKVQLPIGRVINYFDLALRESADPFGRVRMEVVGAVCRGEDRVKLYGGKLTENICQALARDVFVNAIYNLDKAGIKTRFGVHDEAVTEVPVEVATKDTQREIEHIMSQTPNWAPGLPLAAESQIFDRYAK